MERKEEGQEERKKRFTTKNNNKQTNKSRKLTKMINMQFPSGSKLMSF